MAINYYFLSLFILKIKFYEEKIDFFFLLIPIALEHVWANGSYFSFKYLVNATDIIKSLNPVIGTLKLPLMKKRYCCNWSLLYFSKISQNHYS